MTDNGWIGVDLDGTLAYYDGWKGVEHIGDPIPRMQQRVRDWINHGIEVRIFTARVSGDLNGQACAVIQDWCVKHLGAALPVTNEKDFRMKTLWDDRCVQVIPNTGVALQEENE